MCIATALLNQIWFKLYEICNDIIWKLFNNVYKILTKIRFMNWPYITKNGYRIKFIGSNLKYIFLINELILVIPIIN